MYSTCLVCGSSLGGNESIERFPVGRRLAFDAEKGRLWVICPTCTRWNLSPLETRWEAIEQCERRFRGATLRMSTENVGLARLPDGTELVRIGRPLRPEFAAWRYGAVMTGRMRRSWYSAGALATGALTLAGAALAGPLVLLAGVPLTAAGVIGALRSPGGPTFVDTGRAQQALRDNAGEPLVPPGHTLIRARMRQGRELPGGWALDVATGMMATQAQNPLAPVRADEIGYVGVSRHGLGGNVAMRAIAVLLARPNGAGGTHAQVRDAVRLIERAGTPAGFFGRAEHEARRRGWGYLNVWEMPLVVRLALEMASHEEPERRALEGELAELEAAWRDAEELAAISDALSAPAAVEQKLTGLKAARAEHARRVAARHGGRPHADPRRTH
jgi:hypothetical protein